MPNYDAFSHAKTTACIDFDTVTEVFTQAHKEGRSSLYEHEVYRVMEGIGSETPPQFTLIPRGTRPSDDDLMALPGKKVVLKIVSPTIVHKTEVGGVRIVEREPSKIRSAWRRMMYEVPEKYARWIERHPDAAPDVYAGLSGIALEEAISRDLKGVLLVQFMPPDSDAFGNELIVGLRRTREFGMVLSAGLGGTDAELYAERFKKTQAIVAASTQLTDGETFFSHFRQTISFEKLAGRTRGQERIVSDDQLLECFDACILLANYYSQANPDAPFYIDEFEINPFAFTDFLMVPLDGLCRFSLPELVAPARPVQKIKNLLHPETIGIIGVSATRQNFGRIILHNVLAEGYPKEQIRIVREGCDAIDGVRCIPSIEADGKLDLLVVAVPAEHLPDVVDTVVEKDAASSVMLIAGGLGETEDSQERAQQVIDTITAAHAAADGGPVFIGANCMGIVSRPGGYNTWFIPEEKFPRNGLGSPRRAALVSQSGAFMLFGMSRYPHLSPNYMISMGNQTDLTLGDMVTYLKDDDDVDVIAVYAEGFNDLDGLQFCRAVREAVLAGKEVVFYKAGRTPEGKSATSGHTASLAGDYMVAESCVRQAGAVVAQTVEQFQDLFVLAENLHGKKVCGNRLGAISGAGFEAVSMADSITVDTFSMQLVPYSEKATAALKGLLKEKRLESLVSLSNPMDVTPAGDDELHVEVAHIMLEEPTIDAVVLGLTPLAPAMQSLDTAEGDRYSIHNTDSILNRALRLAAQSDKPLVCASDGGYLFEAIREALKEAGVPVFQTADRAVAALARYVQSRLHAASIRCGGCGIR
ncbi:MAG: acetate--CoA ligase family protein [Desulfovibrionales bacterium]|nr:acetate--CoA ligase family protein [Desulfovibrionales bacterium]